LCKPILGQDKILPLWGSFNRYLHSSFVIHQSFGDKLIFAKGKNTRQNFVLVISTSGFTPGYKDFTPLG
jgi:hypothetical protein